MVRCDNCRTEWRADQRSRVFPDIPGLTERVEPGGTVPAGECPACGALVYPVEESLTMTALRHAYQRLNAIPHRYADTDFALIRRAIHQAEQPVRVLVLVEGGLVQGVLTDRPGAEVTVLNQDTEGAEKDEMVPVTGDGHALRGTLQAHDPTVARALIESAWRSAE